VELDKLLESLTSASSAENELAEFEQELAALRRQMEEESRSKQATERSFEETLERLKNFTQRSSDWAWEMGPDGTYTYSSPRVKDILGLAVEEVLGRSPLDLVDPDDVKRVAEILEPALASRSSITALEKDVRHREGHIVHLEMSGVPLFDRDGTFKGYRGMDKDLTGRKAAKKAIDDSRRQVEEVTAELLLREERIAALEEDLGELHGSLGAKENALASLDQELEARKAEIASVGG